MYIFKKQMRVIKLNFIKLNELNKVDICLK